MQEIPKRFYVVENGLKMGTCKEFATRKEAIKYCIHERELDFKVGAINNYYEVYSYLDKGCKCLYTTRDVVYKFMKEEKKVEYDYNKRCAVEGCFRYICGKGDGEVCSLHYEMAFGKQIEDNVNRAIIKVETKIDVAKAISQSLK